MLSVVLFVLNTTLLTLSCLSMWVYFIAPRLLADHVECIKHRITFIVKRPLLFSVWLRVWLWWCTSDVRARRRAHQKWATEKVYNIMLWNMLLKHVQHVRDASKEKEKDEDVYDDDDMDIEMNNHTVDRQIILFLEQFGHPISDGKPKQNKHHAYIHPDDDDAHCGPRSWSYASSSSSSSSLYSNQKNKLDMMVDSDHVRLIRLKRFRHLRVCIVDTVLKVIQSKPVNLFEIRMTLYSSLLQFLTSKNADDENRFQILPRPRESKSFFDISQDMHSPNYNKYSYSGNNKTKKLYRMGEFDSMLPWPLFVSLLNEWFVMCKQNSVQSCRNTRLEYLMKQALDGLMVVLEQQFCCAFRQRQQQQQQQSHCLKRFYYHTCMVLFLKSVLYMDCETDENDLKRVLSVLKNITRFTFKKNRYEDTNIRHQKVYSMLVTETFQSMIKDDLSTRLECIARPRLDLVFQNAKYQKFCLFEPYARKETEYVMGLRLLVMSVLVIFEMHVMHNKCNKKKNNKIKWCAADATPPKKKMCDGEEEQTNQSEEQSKVQQQEQQLQMHTYLIMKSLVQVFVHFKEKKKNVEDEEDDDVIGVYVYQNLVKLLLDSNKKIKIISSLFGSKHRSCLKQTTTCLLGVLFDSLSPSAQRTICINYPSLVKSFQHLAERMRPSDQRSDVQYRTPARRPSDWKSDVQLKQKENNNNCMTRFWLFDEWKRNEITQQPRRRRIRRRLITCSKNMNQTNRSLYGQEKEEENAAKAKEEEDDDDDEEEDDELYETDSSSSVYSSNSEGSDPEEKHLKNYRRTKRTIHFLKHAKHVSQGTTRIDDQHVKTPTLTWEKTNSRVSLYRGSTAVSDELAGYWHGTTPTTRLVWTTWDPTVAFRFSQPHHAASVSSLRHEEQGVFVFAVKKPIPHLLHVTTCQPASTKSIHQAVMGIVDTLEQKDCSGVNIVKKKKQHDKSKRQSLLRQQQKQLLEIAMSDTEKEQERASLLKEKQQEEEQQEHLKPADDDDDEDDITDHPYRYFWPSTFGLFQEPENKKHVFLYSWTDRYEALRLVHSPFNGWVYVENSSQVMLWNPVSWLQPTALLCNTIRCTGAEKTVIQPVWEEQFGTIVFDLTSVEEPWLPRITGTSAQTWDETKPNYFPSLILPLEVYGWYALLPILARYAKHFYFTPTFVEAMQLRFPRFIKETFWLPFLSSKTCQSEKDEHAKIVCISMDCIYISSSTVSKKKRWSRERFSIPCILKEMARALGIICEPFSEKGKKGDDDFTVDHSTIFSSFSSDAPIRTTNDSSSCTTLAMFVYEVMFGGQQV